MKTLKLSRVSSALVLALGVSSGAFATETASSVRGKILDPQGNPAANTTITIKNPMTGASKTVVTNASGAFVANGLRVGGPYTIVVDSDKYKDQEIENVYLQVGQPYRANVQLQEEQIERISVSGSRHAMMTSQTNGVGSSYGAEAIAMAPSFDRDLKDILRNDPLVNIDDDGNAEMSVAGANPRYNSLTVDGVRQDDDFGLNDNGYPTQRSPISLLSVGQVSVSTAAYTARSAGYSGGGVNAVTKSGTNDFEAELFYEYASDSLAGDQTNDEGNDVRNGRGGCPRSFSAMR